MYRAPALVSRRAAHTTVAHRAFRAAKTPLMRSQIHNDTSTVRWSHTSPQTRATADLAASALAFWKARIQKVGLNASLGIELKDVKLEPSVSVELSMLINESHMAATGKVHGGALSALADTAVGFGCYLAMPKTASSFAVVDSAIHFLSSAIPGDTLTCLARPVRTGHLVQVWEADIVKAGDESSPSGQQAKKICTVRSTAVNLQRDPPLPSAEEIQSKIKKNWVRLGSNFNVIRMTKQEIVEKFDKHSDNWEFLVKESKYEPVFHWLADNCKSFEHKAARVLDLACGVGLVGKTLRRNGVEGVFVATDISPKMLEHALATGLYDYTQSQVHDLDLPLPASLAPSASFELAVCTGATEMLSDPLQFLRNVNTALKPGGEFWVTFQHDAGAKPHATEHQGMKVYTPATISEFCTKAGYSVVGEPVIVDAAYFLPNPAAPGTLSPVPFSMWRLKKVK